MPVEQDSPMGLLQTPQHSAFTKLATLLVYLVNDMSTGTQHRCLLLPASRLPLSCRVHARRRTPSTSGDAAAEL